MSKLSGKSGRIKIGSEITLLSVAFAGGLATFSVAAGHGLLAGMFILIKDVPEYPELNNDGKGQLLADADAETLSVAWATEEAPSNLTGGTAQRIIPITEWNADMSSEISDNTDSESGGEWKEKAAAGFKEWSGDFAGLEYSGALDPPVHEELDIQLDIDATQYYSGTAIFKTFKTGAKIKAAEAVAISGTFEGNGDLVKTV